jgi:hypothetical protein
MRSYLSVMSGEETMKSADARLQVAFLLSWASRAMGFLGPLGVQRSHVAQGHDASVRLGRSPASRRRHQCVNRPML